LHVQYSYKSREVIVNNSLLEKFSHLKVKADVYNPDGVVKYSKETTTQVEEDAIKKCFAIPEIEGLADTYFLRLQLSDEKGKAMSINWYWLSKHNDELNWNNSKWYYTPEKDYSDFSALQKLPKTTLKVNYTTSREESKTVHKITISNTGKAVAFFVHLRALKNKDGDDILPVIFEDNYLLLAPGESRTIDCNYENKDAGNAAPYIVISAWNLDIDHSAVNKDAGFINEMQ